MNDYANIVQLTDENGQEVDFEHIDTIKYKDEEYVILRPVEPFEGDGEDEESVVILRIVPGDDGDSYESIADAAILDEVFDKFVEMMESDEYSFEE